MTPFVMGFVWLLWPGQAVIRARWMQLNLNWICESSIGGKLQNFLKTEKRVKNLLNVL